MRWVVFGIVFSVTGLGMFLTYAYFDRVFSSGGADVASLISYTHVLLITLAVLSIALVVVLSALSFTVVALKRDVRSYAYGLTKEMAQTSDQLRKFYEFSPVPYILVSPEGKVRRPNKASLRLLGLDEEHLVGSQLFDLFSDPIDPRMVQMYREQVRRGASLEQKELQVRTSHGEMRWVLFSAGNMSSNGVKDKLALVTLVDIHEQKELERIKTEFLSLASHQLRAPLANLKWYIDFLLTRRAQELTDGVKTYLLQMYKRNEEMIDLVNTLLNLSRVEMGRLKVEIAKEDLAPLLKSVMEELAPILHEKSLTLKTDIPEQMIISTDVRLFRIVAQNILANSIRYTPANGTVTVQAMLRNNQAVFAVTDTGIGIPLEEQGRIFNKMYRASNAQQVEVNGNGIGLYMCKALVEAMGGTIGFTSKEGEGTTFTVALPI